MTWRDAMSRRLRLALVPVWIGCFFFICAIGVSTNAGNPVACAWLSIVGTLLVGLPIAGLYVFGLRCPYCRGRLTNLLLQRSVLRIDPRVRFCPYCGESLDVEHEP
jgi:hypothetical protein